MMFDNYLKTYLVVMKITFETRPKICDNVTAL